MAKLDELSNAQLIVALEHTIADLFDEERPVTLSQRQRKTDTANQYALFIAEIACRLGVTAEELEKAYEEAE